jgi:hypothetical protein
MNEYAGVSEWTGGIPVELPVDAVLRYVQGETLTLERFDLLKDYFEGRIIKLVELEQFKQGDNWEATTTNEIIALIKGEK